MICIGVYVTKSIHRKGTGKCKYIQVHVTLHIYLNRSNFVASSEYVAYTCKPLLPTEHLESYRIPDCILAVLAEEEEVIANQCVTNVHDERGGECLKEADLTEEEKSELRLNGKTKGFYFVQFICFVSDKKIIT